MRTSNWTPSIVPNEDQDVCLVIDDLGQLRQVFRETDVDAAGFDTVVADLLDGQYADPLRVISFTRGTCFWVARPSARHRPPAASDLKCRPPLENSIGLTRLSKFLNL
jgi:hypothetical protein